MQETIALIMIYIYIFVGFLMGVNAVPNLPKNFRDTPGARLVSSYSIAVFWPFYALYRLVKRVKSTPQPRNGNFRNRGEISLKADEISPPTSSDRLQSEETLLSEILAPPSTTIDDINLQPELIEQQWQRQPAVASPQPSPSVEKHAVPSHTP